MGNLTIDNLVQAVAEIENLSSRESDQTLTKEDFGYIQQNRISLSKVQEQKIVYCGSVLVETKVDWNGTIVKPIHITNNTGKYEYEKILTPPVFHAVPKKIAEKYGVEFDTYNTNEFHTSVSQTDSLEKLKGQAQGVINAREEMERRVKMYIEAEVSKFLKQTEYFD